MYTRNYSMQDELVSETKRVKHVFRRVIFLKNKNSIIKPREMNTEVIILPGGGLVLPYFNSHGKWKIVLVSQFRPAIKTITVEAPGGRLDSQEPSVALSRELFEEAGIKVKPQSIIMAVNEYTHPSILSSRNIGGIVKINQRMVKNKKRAGKSCENEWTQVEVFDLVELIKRREANLVVLDLMTSRLLDEVAKTVGLLVKKY